MIKITVELDSATSEERDAALGMATISLQETDKRGTAGGYRAVFRGKSGQVLRDITIEGFPRKQLLAWDLLTRCLDEAFGERNIKPEKGAENIKIAFDIDSLCADCERKGQSAAASLDRE